MGPGPALHISALWLTVFFLVTPVPFLAGSATITCS
jgi:hypothetical protein